MLSIFFNRSNPLWRPCDCYWRPKPLGTEWTNEAGWGGEKQLLLSTVELWKVSHQSTTFFCFLARWYRASKLLPNSESFAFLSFFSQSRVSFHSQKTQNSENHPLLRSVSVAFGISPTHTYWRIVQWVGSGKTLLIDLPIYSSPREDRATLVHRLLALTVIPFLPLLGRFCSQSNLSISM